MTYKKLKKAAHDFAQKHNVTYTLALKAVDEPLHELRDLTVNNAGETGFRLRGEAHYHSPFAAYDPHTTDLEPEDFYSGIMEAQDLESYKSRELMTIFAQRLNFIEDSNVDDIWHYRQLQRSGLLPEGFPNLEPLFHHFVGRLPEIDDNLFTLLSKRVGVFAVFIGQQSYLNSGLEHVMGVTLKEIQGWQAGEAGTFTQAFEPIPMGAIEGFVYLANSTDGVIAVISPKLLTKEDFVGLELGAYHFSLKSVNEGYSLQPYADNDALLCDGEGSTIFYPLKPQNVIFL